MNAPHESQGQCRFWWIEFVFCEQRFHGPGRFEVTSALFE